LETASHESLQQDGERLSRSLGIQQLSRRSGRYKYVPNRIESNVSMLMWLTHFLFLFLYLYLIYKVYSIVNEEPNAEECKSKIKAYEEANRAQIVIRQSQRADEERSIQDRIASEQREAERNKRELQEEEKAIALTKRKLKQESTQVALGVSPLHFLVHSIVCSSIVSHCI
jgi:hypothetical protein